MEYGTSPKCGVNLSSNPKFLIILERLNIIAKKILSEGRLGMRPGNRKGGSTEFADHKHYSPGDEIRYVDWNIYARHNQLFVKEFLAEDKVHITIFVDSSLSMNVGTPTKLEAAKKLAASFSYIGLANFDSVSLYKFSDKLHLLRPFMNGKHQIMQLLKTLDSITVDGNTDMLSAFSNLPPQLKGKNVAILISDLWDIKGYSAAIAKLLQQRAQVNLVHLINEEEINPKLHGLVTFLDTEKGQRRKINVTEDAIRHYQSRMKHLLEEIEQYCHKQQIYYVRLDPNRQIEEMIISILQQSSFIETA